MASHGRKTDGSGGGTLSGGDRGGRRTARVAFHPADAVYGSDYGFRKAVEDAGLGYVVGVRTDHAVSVAFRQVRVKALLAEVAAGGWHRISCDDGTIGPRWYEWPGVPSTARSRSGTAAGR